MDLSMFPMGPIVILLACLGHAASVIERVNYIGTQGKTSHVRENAREFMPKSMEGNDSTSGDWQGKVFVHIGPPKTGTSYLQEVMCNLQDVLDSHGVALPIENDDSCRHFSFFCLGIQLGSEERKRQFKECTLTDHIAEFQRALAEQEARKKDLFISSEGFFAYTNLPEDVSVDHGRKKLQAFHDSGLP